ncbi:tripartite tricarboxylate transporter TctB family protein [Salibacterium halotolerans]|uniref:Tripartite tricarboxylate transporter TctB family protein n=1 Tax=Salibacterium halotolerans TaxID=1884432 RepID=A0A1I5U6A3_9BACI|nr:tripartite tricarboxylate transporter TctB family protein [Salibacterium halotolerans]SFP90803.1 Tripartite tricarboxylate transporter TctB family protein [Salibacterium halotolerans]
MISKERYVWLFLFMSGIIIWKVLIPTQVQVNQNSSTYGPEFFPNVLAIALIVISAFSLLSTFFIRSSQEHEEKKEKDKEGSKWVGFIVFIIMGVYVFTIEFLHYIPATIIFMLLIMWVLSVRKWYLYIVMFGIIFFVQYVFQNLLYIQLP